MESRRNDLALENGFKFFIRGETLFLQGSFILENVKDQYGELEKLISKYPRKYLMIDLTDVSRIDSLGVKILNQIKKKCKARDIRVELTGASAAIEKTIQLFSAKPEVPRVQPVPENFFENLGHRVYYFLFKSLPEFFYLFSDLFIWSFVDLFTRKSHRKGEFINQTVLIGVNAIPLVALISFLIGLVLALQSAAQLRQFGANIFIVDLISIAMTREMGPLLTAIMIAGRSGSAIASEIATMKVTEELDALQTMGLNPTRYVVIPKLHASVFTLPVLTILADILGILGGIIVAYFYLDVNTGIFYRRMEEILLIKDIATGFLKSLIFAGIIVLTGSFFGFRAKGGAEGVGRVTTASVVTSIFLVILADSVIGLVLY